MHIARFRARSLAEGRNFWFTPARATCIFVEVGKGLTMKTRIGVSVSLACMIALACFASLPAFASAEGSFQRTLQVTGPVSIDLATGSGSVNVRTGASGQVEISGHIKVTNWFGGDAEQRVKSIENNPPIQQSGN